MNEREYARDNILNVLRKKIPLSQSSPHLSSFSKELSYGVCRYFFRLERILDKFLTKKIKDDDIHIILLMGLYELYFLNHKDYAVVKESVDLISKKKKWAKGFVNAVLRRACTHHEQQAKEYNNIVEDNHPTWFINQIKKNWPNDWSAILSANDQHAPMTIRVNLQKSSTHDYLIKLEAAGIHGQLHPFAPEAIVLDQPCNVSSLPLFDLGYCSVQDAAAQLAAHLLDLKSGLHILDACAAPGGKTCHILELQPDVSCTAIDIEPKRIQRIHDNLARLHLNAKILCADASQPATWWDGHSFDRILLDAPCSATGVIRRHPDIKILRMPEDIEKINTVQSALLKQLWPLLKIGGRLLYVTCSVIKEENDIQLADFLKNHDDAKVVELSLPWGKKTSYGYQIFPGCEEMDGFYYSLIEKTAISACN